MQRLLPPVLAVSMFALLALLHFAHPTVETRVSLAPEIAWIAIAIGIGGLVAARIQFTQSDSEIMTFAEPRNLVINGLFAITRNPMYLSMLLLINGAALLVDLWCGLLAPIIFFAAANWWYIPFEEKRTAQTFGESYFAYARRVRRWL